jgi:hypothetical protein
LALVTAAVHIYLGAITHIMVATNPKRRPRPVAAATLMFFVALFISMASRTSC